MGITVFRRASTRPRGEPKRKKPETLKSRRVALVRPSGTSEAAAGGQEAVLALRGSPEEVAEGTVCRLGEGGEGAQCCCFRSPAQAQFGVDGAGMSPVLRALGLRTGHVAVGVLGRQH